MSTDLPSTEAEQTNPSILRLIECSRCKLPFQTPLRLPCGKTLCRACMPPVRRRVGISYPGTEDRKLGFSCYWDGREHCLGDCGVDVLMGRLVEVFLQYTTQGKLELEFELELELEQLVRAVRAELDCQVCYALILDPLTTPCGHTFCRKCVGRVLDHSDLCPICRRKLNLPLAVEKEPVNERVATLIEAWFSDEVAERRETLAENEHEEEGEGEGEHGGDGYAGDTLPLFVGALTFPMMPVFLHIFEPRYRLMMQRVMASPSRRFGVLAFNRSGAPQGELGLSLPFMQYGTVMTVDRFELLPDGRSLIVATGLSRFRVVESRLRDGYYVGRFERVTDISLSEEEDAEMAEVASRAAALSRESRENLESTEEADADSSEQQPIPLDAPLESLSTRQLLRLCLDFVHKRQEEGVVWLHPRVRMAYGEIPDDPVLFPYWLATVLNIAGSEGYTLLHYTSVRERMKMAALWVRDFQGRGRQSSTRKVSAIL
ncbi:hypothetical protein ASPZODRAFT_1994078 [Penicilliopsis zonata CBS 506.65]|uniref:RING-type domain-containing protein n=1 Tax=Penicilliopsis zonata CBS 506.65 TaxID=1073090 RepID=A0A1L9SHU5_9EURO|nr:hypothetical protein ASPZODRAFT_1994078 [Penicilliopsis zonata CBS 506.65]OJJ46676.1 hypothetical protein ASPZODRAFT_1994078 [Penicilliopsis zonata CBS 506.65]